MAVDTTTTESRQLLGPEQQALFNALMPLFLAMFNVPPNLYARESAVAPLNQTQNYGHQLGLEALGVPQFAMPGQLGRSRDWWDSGRASSVEAANTRRASQTAPRPEGGYTPPGARNWAPEINYPGFTEGGGGGPFAEFCRNNPGHPLCNFTLGGGGGGGPPGGSGGGIGDPPPPSPGGPPPPPPRVE